MNANSESGELKTNNNAFDVLEFEFILGPVTSKMYLTIVTISLYKIWKFVNITSVLQNTIVTSLSFEIAFTLFQIIFFISLAFIYNAVFFKINNSTYLYYGVQCILNKQTNKQGLFFRFPCNSLGIFV